MAKWPSNLGGKHFQVKHPAESMPIYPSGKSHKVNPVISGSPLVIVAQIKSDVKHKIAKGFEELGKIVVISVLPNADYV